MTDIANDHHPNRLPANPLGEDNLPMRCSECVGFMPAAASGAVGTCRGVPPTAIVVGIGKDLMGRPTPQIGAYWPNIESHHWCLQFRRRPPAFAMPVNLESPSEGNA